MLSYGHHERPFSLAQAQPLVGRNPVCETSPVSTGAEVYEVGDQVGLAIQFGTPESPVDPSGVEVRVRDPQGRSARLTFGKDEAVTRVAPGVYQVVITAGVPGRWQYRFVGVKPHGEHNGFFDVFDLGSDHS